MTIELLRANPWWELNPQPTYVESSVTWAMGSDIPASFFDNGSDDHKGVFVC